MRVTAVVPAFREEDLIGATVGALYGVEGIDSVLVIDDASGDGTAAAARAAGATVVVNSANLGKGGSLNRVVQSLEFEVLLLVDGDLGTHASEAGLLLEPVLSGKADLAIAAFPPPRSRGGFGFAQGAGRAGIKLITGALMRSPLSGQRAMTREVFRSVTPFDGGFGVEVGMTIDALRAGFNVLEIDTTMSHRETGRDIKGFMHRGRQLVAISGAVARRLGQRRGPRSRRPPVEH